MATNLNDFVKQNYLDVPTDTISIPAVVAGTKLFGEFDTFMQRWNKRDKTLLDEIIMKYQNYGEIGCASLMEIQENFYEIKSDQDCIDTLNFLTGKIQGFGSISKDLIKFIHLAANKEFVGEEVPIYDLLSATINSKYDKELIAIVNYLTFYMNMDENEESK